MTTVNPMIETIRIGHMIGPPFLKLSMRKFSVNAPPFLTSGAAVAAGERVAATAGDPLGAVRPEAPVTGAPGATLIPGAGAV